MQTSIQRSSLPAIGAALACGYFAGLFSNGFNTFALIAAPRDGGEFTGPWGERGMDIPFACSCWDGATNTKVLAEAGSKIAVAATALMIEDCNDWYVPSRDELEILYRAFKPSVSENSCSFRDGDNPSSVPTGYPYTAVSPAQTIADGCKDGQPNAFDEAWYWSSTQYSADYAWVQDFGDGNQGLVHKAAECSVRAVRRLLVI